MSETLKRLIVLMLAMVCAFLVMPSQASSVGVFTKANTTLPADTTPKDSFGRDTPRSTVQGFVQALVDKDPMAVEPYLENGTKKSKLAQTTIDNLKVALDDGGRLEPILNISDKPEGNLADKLPSNEEKVGTIEIANAQIDIILVKKTTKDNVGYWQLSQKTLSELPTLPMHTKTFISMFKPDALKGRLLFGHDMAAIVSLACLVFIGLLVIWVLVVAIYSISAFLYPKISKKQFAIPPKVILPLAVVILAYILPELMVQVGIPVTLRLSVTRAKDVVAWVAMAWLVMRLIDAVFKRMQNASLRRNRPEQVSILTLLRKVAKAFMLIMALIIIFGNLGFDLTTGIAALGVGGLALAFGAQKSVENLIGSLVVVADRPVHVGDYCRFGAMEGTIIDIGIRSSRIRTLNRTIVTVPNGEFSSMQIENYSARDMFYFLHHLYLQRDVVPQELDRCIKGLTEFLKEHKDTNDEWNQVRISELRQDCFVLEVRCYISAMDVRVFYDKQSWLIIDILEHLGQYQVKHALPTQTVNLNQT